MAKNNIIKYVTTLPEIAKLRELKSFLENENNANFDLILKSSSKFNCDNRLISGLRENMVTMVNQMLEDSLEKCKSLKANLTLEEYIKMQVSAECENIAIYTVSTDPKVTIFPIYIGTVEDIPTKLPDCVFKARVSIAQYSIENDRWMYVSSETYEELLSAEEKGEVSNG